MCWVSWRLLEPRFKDLLELEARENGNLPRGCLMDSSPLYFDDVPSRIYEFLRPYPFQRYEIINDHYDSKDDPTYPKSPIYRMIMVQSRIWHRIGRNSSNQSQHLQLPLLRIIITVP